MTPKPSKETSMSDLIAICQTCRKPTSDGHLGVAAAALNAYREAVTAWKQANPGPLLEQVVHDSDGRIRERSR